MNMIVRFALVALIAFHVSPSRAAVLHDETVSGDFPNDRSTPASLVVAIGSNQVLGNTGRSASGVVDRDYFAIRVPTGLLLTGITVLPGTQVGGGASFIGLQAGTQVTVDPNGSSASGLLGWTLYAPADIGQDILPSMNTTSQGASGFTAPLPAGDYAFWIQELATGTFSYGFDLHVAPVPLPAAAWLLGSALMGLGLIGRRRVVA
jgi:hypothetical protein